jgi:hypothetical protein
MSSFVLALRNQFQAFLFAALSAAADFGSFVSRQKNE